ncbi:MAG: serine hydrolase [Pseudonocardiaceae bacterium]|nr:serine hydrolase [Pseudonocardiaceae bacterium]
MARPRLRSRRDRGVVERRGSRPPRRCGAGRHGAGRRRDPPAYGWLSSRHGEHEITWHNAGTGGFRSYVGYDRATGRGVVVLGNTAEPVEAIGLRLLGVAAAGADDRDGWSYPTVVAGLMCLYAAGCGLFAALRRGGRRPDRIGLVALATEAAIALIAAYVIAAWTLLPPALWTGGGAIAAGGLAVLGQSWTRLPVRAGGRAWSRWSGVILRLGLVAAGVGYLVAVA